MAMAVAMVLLTAPVASAARAPAGFFGVVPQASLASPDFARLGDLGLSLRLPVAWYRVEPEPGVFDFGALDREIGEAARRGIRVLPQVGGTPSWLAASPARAPLGRDGLAAWRSFLRRLVLRYGPGGELWVGGGGALPVRRWQIWNEPNFPLYWRHPSPRGYAKLLHASAAAIRGADPDAVIVAAGVAPIERAMLPWEFLRRLYRVPGAKRDFDVAALHPYSASWRGVEAEVRKTRQVMARAGEGREPLLVTEIGVASDAKSPTGFDLGPEGQARFLRQAFARLAAERRRWHIGGVYWFTWEDGTAPDSSCSFCEYAGLFDVDEKPKPAWWALRQIVPRLTPVGSASLAP
jgi:hypothetical protein